MENDVRDKKVSRKAMNTLVASKKATASGFHIQSHHSVAIYFLIWSLVVP